VPTPLGVALAGLAAGATRFVIVVLPGPVILAALPGMSARQPCLASRTGGAFAGLAARLTYPAGQAGILFSDFAEELLSVE